MEFPLLRPQPLPAEMEALLITHIQVSLFREWMVEGGVHQTGL